MLFYFKEACARFVQVKDMFTMRNPRVNYNEVLLVLIFVDGHNYLETGTLPQDYVPSNFPSKTIFAVLHTMIYGFLEKADWLEEAEYLNAYQSLRALAVALGSLNMNNAEPLNCAWAVELSMICGFRLTLHNYTETLRGALPPSVWQTSLRQIEAWVWKFRERLSQLGGIAGFTN